jgi:uncharacterized protein
MALAGPQGDRELSLDVVRGVAVLGILLMNIVGMALPAYAYIDPSWYGGHTGANFWAWFSAYVLVDGKMRALFTMLFGAGVVMIAERADAKGGGAAVLHYRRMGLLLLFGLFNAWFLFFGDILYFYALAGMIAFLFWRLSARTLLIAGGAIIGLLAASGWVEAFFLDRLRDAATAPGAGEAARKAWAEASRLLALPREMVPMFLEGFRGDFLDALKVRGQIALLFETAFMIRSNLWEALGLSLIGMGLYKTGFFTGKWPRAAYLRLIWIGLGVGLPITATLGWWVGQSRWDPIVLTVADYSKQLVRPFTALAYAAIVLVALQAGWRGAAVDRLSAAGRAALTNYLGANLLTSLIFNGYGLGLYGHLERWQTYGVVLAVWAVQLAWSKPWLEHFRYGPVEWLWRSATYGRLQPMRIARPAAAPA